MPYVRTVKTASGATAVQIVYSSHRGSREIEHLGSAHDDVELEQGQPIIGESPRLDLQGVNFVLCAVDQSIPEGRDSLLISTVPGLLPGQALDGVQCLANDGSGRDLVDLRYVLLAAGDSAIPAGPCCPARSQAGTCLADGCEDPAHRPNHDAAA